MNTAADTIVVRPRRLTRPRLSFVCLSYCGGGAGAYHAWQDHLPADVELASVCYPGREGRFLEPVARDWRELVDDATKAVRQAAATGAYVLYGHSMGGWVAFDVLAALQEAGGPLPQRLIISSANAPCRGLTAQDRFPASGDSDERMLAWFERHGLVAQHVLDDPDLRDMAIRLMRADVQVRDTFRFTATRPIAVPVQLITATDDGVIDPAAPRQWDELTGGNFHHTKLPGGHFFTPEIWRRLPEFMHLALSAPAA